MAAEYTPKHHSATKPETKPHQESIMEKTVNPQATPAIKNQSNDHHIEALEPFEYIPGHMTQGATKSEKELAELANHVMDVARGAALVFELLNDADSNASGDRGNYLDRDHLQALRTMATRSLLCLNQKAEEIADSVAFRYFEKS